jgi:hypothetical protein
VPKNPEEPMLLGLSNLQCATAIARKRTRGFSVKIDAFNNEINLAHSMTNKFKGHLDFT